MLQRAPIFLRVVIDQDGTVDALDQLDDEPRPGETVHVYEQVPGTHSRAHLCIRGEGRGASGWYEIAEYTHRPDVDGEQLRDRDAWQTWADVQRLHRRVLA